MMQEFDDTIAKELYFDNQLIEDTAEDTFNALLIWIVGALLSGGSTRAIKKHILAQKVDANLKENLLKTIEQQQAIILGEDKSFNLAQETVAGLTFVEAIRERERAIRKRAIIFMARTKELQKTQQGREGLDTIIKEEVQRYIKNTTTFWQTQTKSARNYAYKTQDKRYSDIKGWISVAILDNRTSPICMGLHNKFYSIANFKDRGAIPDKPPRHPNCRSILLTVREGIDIAEYEGENLETFMKRNPRVAKDLMGKAKHEMWINGEAKLDKYIDLKGRRFYTNAEIVKKLDIRP